MGAISSIHDSIQNYPDLYNKFSETDWLGTLYKGEEYAVTVLLEILRQRYVLYGLPLRHR